MQYNLHMSAYLFFPCIRQGKQANVKHTGNAHRNKGQEKLRALWCSDLSKTNTLRPRDLSLGLWLQSETA